MKSAWNSQIICLRWNDNRNPNSDDQFPSNIFHVAKNESLFILSKEDDRNRIFLNDYSFRSLLEMERF